MKEKIDPKTICKRCGSKEVYYRRLCRYCFDKIKKRPIYFANSPEVVYQQGMSCQDVLGRALYFFLYLTGARINEATDFQRVKLTKFDDRIEIILKTLKQRRPEFKSRVVVIPLGKNARCKENDMWLEVSKYLSNFDDREYPFKKWDDMHVYLRRSLNITVFCNYPISKTSWEHRTITKPCHAHLLRHFRATHLVSFYSKTRERELCAFFGWRNPMMASEYVQLKDLKNMFEA